MKAGLIPPSVVAPQAAALARQAEDFGCDFLACGEHVFFHGPTSNAFVALAAAAGATERIRLLSALTILPVYSPALAAKLIATLNGVSGGRFELGIRIGGEFPAEFEAVGVPVAERGRRTDEALAVLDELFTGGPVNFDDRFTTLSGQQLQPRLVQRPRPPIWLVQRPRPPIWLVQRPRPPIWLVQRPRPPIWLGGRREASMVRGGRHADGWLLYLITPERLASGLATVREAAQQAGRAVGEIRADVFCWAAVDAVGNWARRTVTGTVSALYQQDLWPKASQLLVAGTPAAVAARLREYVCAGAGSIVFAPACEEADVARVIRTFAEEVLPHLRDLPAETSARA